MDWSNSYFRLRSWNYCNYFCKWNICRFGILLIKDEILNRNFLKKWVNFFELIKLELVVWGFR